MLELSGLMGEGERSRIVIRDVESYAGGAQLPTASPNPECAAAAVARSAVCLGGRFAAGR